jgi:hypothetical protein
MSSTTLSSCTTSRYIIMLSTHSLTCCRVLILAFFALDAVEPYHQQFSLKNYTLHYNFATKERVPVPALLMICAVAPAIIIAIYTLVIDGIFSHGGSGRKKYTLKARLWELNCGILGLLLAVGASFVITGKANFKSSEIGIDADSSCSRHAQERDWETETGSNR